MKIVGCCIENSTDRRFFVVAALRLPRSLRKAVAFSLREPSLSTATGIKKICLTRLRI